MVRLPTLVGAATLALSKIASAKYALANSYDATNFFDGFEFRNGTGSGGFAQYVDAATAEAKSLAGIRDGKVYLGVDNVTENTTGGRESVRVITKNVWTNGLYIADIAHMPGNACGVWPAYWNSDPDWPNSGEINYRRHQHAENSHHHPAFWKGLHRHKHRLGSWLSPRRPRL